MKQMTYLSSGSLSIGYNYSSTQNNGKITSQQDYVSGETVTYAYDTLNRLATAGTSAWGQSYAYDGFREEFDRHHLDAGDDVPEWHVAYGASTNPGLQRLRRCEWEYRDNGGSGCSALSAYNSYDVENRIIFSGVGTVPAVEYASRAGQQAGMARRVDFGFAHDGAKVTLPLEA